MLRDGTDIKESVGEVRGCGFLLLIYLQFVVVVVNNIAVIVLMIVVVIFKWLSGYLKM